MTSENCVRCCSLGGTWLAFFLLDTLNRFTLLAEHRSDIGVAEYCRAAAQLLKSNVAEYGWDGDWYLRAYFDDGSRLGSNQNQECRIDSLPQSWAVLSGGATEDRAEIAMDSVYRKLVKKEDRLKEISSRVSETVVRRKPKLQVVNSRVHA